MKMSFAYNKTLSLFSLTKGVRRLIMLAEYSVDFTNLKIECRHTDFVDIERTVVEGFARKFKPLARVCY